MNKKSSVFILFVSLVTFLTILYSGCSTNSNVGSITKTKSALKEIYNGKVVLIVNGDDLGVTEIFTDATIDAYLKGSISSTTIIANGHDVERAIALLKSHPELPVGIHLTLTGDWKPLTSGASLCDTTGLMWNTAEEAVQHVIPAEAAAEWEAQIKKIIDAGLDVSHIDSHMGCYFQSQELYAAAYNLAKKYKLPLTSPFIPDFLLPGERKFFALSSYSGIYRMGNTEETLENRTAAYWKKFSELSPGMHYLFTHQGWMPSDSIITGDLDLRINDYKFWTGKDTKKELSDKGYIMIGCTPLKEEFQAALKDLK
jgi:predicted glycoside hydrolase/deacetylase ChbG (UPF0249 family)